MTKYFTAGGIAFALMLLTAAFALPDVIILKNGQVINGVTIKEDGETLVCETLTQSFFIHRSTVKNIIRTGKKPFLERVREFIPTLPNRIRLFVKDYFAVAASLAGLLILLAGLLVFKFLWINMRPVMAGGVNIRRTLKAIQTLDANEKSVLREFFLQQADTLEMPVEDRVVAGLISKGILQAIHEHGQYSICGLMLPVTLSPAAAKRIRPRTVDLPADSHAMNDETVKDKLARSRPQFMYDMAGFYQSLEKNRRDFR